jgi:HMP-PP phosphatase
MRHVIGEFSLDAFLITGNGTRIHSLEGEELYRRDLAPDVAEEVLHSAWETTASMHSLTTAAGTPGRRSRNY